LQRTKKLTTAKEIQKHIEKTPLKTILFSEDFKEYGGAEAVKSALHRMVKTGGLKRLAKGIYVKPGYSELIKKETVPDLEEVAAAIAKRDRVRLIPTGAMALYKLGLSTQIPLRAVYVTDGTARKIPIGNRTITFKQVAPKKLSLKGEISTLVVQAMSELGKDGLDETTKTRLVELLKKEKYDQLKHDIKLAPQWMGEIMANALKKWDI
jgi:hypothetical protein